MHCFHLIKKKLILVLSALLLVTTGIAQDAAAPAEKTVTSDNNQLEILLIATAILLVFVIWGLGQVLVVLGRQALDKSKNAGKALTVLLIAGLLFASQTSFAQDAATAEATKVLPNYGGLSSTTFYMLVTLVIAEVIVILSLTFYIRRISAELLPQKEGAPVHKSPVSAWWAGLDKKIFTKAIPIEKEADVLLDHNYDGIQELDNALPPWWKFGFYFTIFVAIIYLLNFHVFHYGKSPAEEYIAEMDKAKIDKEIYEANNKDKVDENNIPYADAAGLATAKDIFTAKCYVCHGKLGEGGVGPNLTDDYWLHKGSLNDIYHSIKTGYPDKGMQSWASVYTPKEISYLASYIKTLHGTNPPNAKAPQGDFYVDPSAAKDSAKTVKPDSVVAKKTN